MAHTILAAFAHERALRGALDETRELARVQTYTPMPPDDDETSKLPVVILVAGLSAALASFALQAASSVWAYRFDIGGRPLVAWPSFIPTAFENGVLAAVVCGFLGFCVINHLPRLYDPVDEAGLMRRASRDWWVLRLDGGDATELRRILANHGALQIEELPA